MFLKVIVFQLIKLLLINNKLSKMSKRYEYLILKLSQIVDDNTYRNRDDINIDSLVRQIRQDGQLVPVIVEPARQSGYRLICGFRRTEALRHMHRSEIEAKVMYNLTREQAYHIAISENMERGTLTPWDIVNTALKLREQESYTNAQIAKVFGGVSIRTIQRYLRVAEKSSEEYKRALKQSDLTIQQVYEALKHNIPASEMLSRGRSVRYLRELSRLRGLPEYGEGTKLTCIGGPDGAIEVKLTYRPGEQRVNMMIKSLRLLLHDLELPDQ